MVAAEPVSAPPSPVHDHEPVAASVADDLVPGPREFLVPRPAASAPADVRSLARIERARRRAQRKVEREQKMARKLAQRFDQYAGAVYQQESEIAPWAHWEQAAASRREITGDLAAGLTDLQRSRAAEARAAADRVEERTGIVVEDRSVMHQCVFHRNTETRVRCTRCAEPFCDQCLVTVGPKRELICVECAVKAAGVRERRRRG
jgi:hypothetical protein